MNYEIDDTGIGVFDGYFTPQECDYYIQFWKMAKECNLTEKHANVMKKGKQLLADDERAFVVPPMSLGHDITYNTGPFINKLWHQIYPIYGEKFRMNFSFPSN